MNVFLNVARYHLVPPVFIVFFTCAIQYLAIVGKGEDFSLSSAWRYTRGNSTSWSWCGIIFVWAVASLLVPSKSVRGPETPFRFRPTYKDNGFSYYCFTFVAYLAVDAFAPSASSLLFDNFPYLLGSLNCIAFILCIFLLIKGKIWPTNAKDVSERHPILYEFYRGVELHPTVFGVDVKQLTNCRIGLMAWQIFISAFFLTSLRRSGFSLAFAVNFILQTIYIAKFFWWEAGYFYTLDMMLDRAGYYICWGCLVWVPCLYTYSSYYLVNHPSSLSTIGACTVFIIGVFSIFLNYRVDYEKQVFRSSPEYKCRLWGNEASFVPAEYEDFDGRRKRSALLTTGFWGVARHMNYTFELLAALSWCTAAGFNNSPSVYFYFIFLFGLLVHRAIRDDRRCRQKYGKNWDVYCSKVRYQLFPHVW